MVTYRVATAQCRFTVSLVLAASALLMTSLGHAQIPLPLPSPPCEILSSPMAGSDSPTQPAPAGQGQGEQIKTLAVRIATSDALFSDTHDDVWLDIGPKAWKIGDQFERGTTRTIYIDISKSLADQDQPSLVPLFTNDIAYVRIEKKGICGLTDAPDSIFAPNFLQGFNPADPIGSMHKQAQAAQYLVDQKKTLMDQQQGIIDQQVKNVAAAQAVIDSAANTISTAPQLAAQIQNQIVDLQKSIAQTPMMVTKEVCKTNDIVTGFAFGIGALITKKLVCSNVNVINDAWSRLTGALADAQKAQNNLSANLASATVQKAAALQSLTVATSLKAAAEANKIQAQIEYELATRTLAEVQHRLADLQELAKKTPLDQLQKLGIPTPGEWQVSSMTLIVNGRDYASYVVNDRLKQGHHSWTGTVRTMSAEETFVNGLRVNINKETPGDEFSRVTTLFKNIGISGWEQTPVPAARVVGVLRHSPSAGGDDYVSLDLELERVETRGHAFILDGNHGIAHKRYIRVEEKRRGENGVEDTRYKGWKIGDRFAVEGPAFRDTDRNTFFEVHPVDPSHVIPLKPGDDGASSTVGLWWDRIVSK